MKRISDRTKHDMIVLGGSVLLVMSAVFVVAVLNRMDFQPSGNDIWSHLYKGDIAYHNLLEGRYYQLYSEYWYNGTQLFRYWAPLSYYVIALLEFVSGGDIVMAYRYFAAFSIIVGGIPWILWGRDTKRPVFAAAVAILWFFLPENIRVYFCEGNTPRMMTAVVIPYVMYFMWRYLRRDKRFSLIGVMLSVCCMVLSHVMITAMLGVAACVFLVFDCITNRNVKKAGKTLAAMGIGLMLAGIWLIPALSGGIMEMDSSAGIDVMELWMADFSTLLNPMNRINGVTDTFYYGISVLVLSVAGIVLAERKKRAGYFLFVLILLMSTPAFLPILSKLPLSTMFWMSRFAAIAYGLFLFSLMEWQTLKRKYCVVVFFILAIDCLPSFHFSRYATPASETAIEHVNVLKENTAGRTALMDLSSFGSYPSWGLSIGEDAVKSTFGWAWQGASTSSNIVMLNTSLDYEAYDYLFDRCVELGNDTVLLKKELIGTKGHTEEEVFAGAERSGFYLCAETDAAFILKKETPDTFGVRTEYDGLALGHYADLMTMFYPSFQEGDSVYIDDYAPEELKKYRTLFLSGVCYHDRQQAEKILRDAAASGTRVVVDITHVQEDRATKQKSFLGVTSQPVTIQDRYSSLMYGGNEILTKDFPEEYAEWFTGYIGEVSHVLGAMAYHGQELTWLGKNATDPNIYFLGLNVMYHAIETEDTAVFHVLDEVLGIERGVLPKREIVPMQVSFGKTEIHIRSEEENVNTTLAYQDNFVSESQLWQENNLLFVKEKDTKISIKYPKKEAGMAVSILGVLAALALFVLQMRGTGRTGQPDGS